VIRRFGSPPDARRIYRPRPGVYALLPRGDQLLLTSQCDPDPDLQLPGGGIDPGEAAIPALHREVFEETGWRIAAPQRLGAFRRFVFMPEYDLWAEKLCHIFLARPVYRLGPPTEPDHMAIWMRARLAAARLGNAGDRYFAARFVQGLLPGSARKPG
jgi:8-oxo-dGTP diphosphatase